MLTEATDESFDAAAERELSPSHNQPSERPALTPEQQMCVCGWAEVRQALTPDQCHSVSAHLLQQSEKNLIKFSSVFTSFSLSKEFRGLTQMSLNNSETLLRSPETPEATCDEKNLDFISLQESQLSLEKSLEFLRAYFV